MRNGKLPGMLLPVLLYAATYNTLERVE